MEIRYTQQEYDSAKSYEGLRLLCIHCNKIFLKKKKYIKRILEGSAEKTTCEFCSIKCSDLHRITSITKPCAWCNKPVTRVLAETKKSKTGNMFCNHSCSASYSNTHKTTGTRVSKLEKHLAIELVKVYPDLEFHFNRKDTINSELDIYIPKLKLAFELNGIFHYEPIYGKKKLSQIKNNDKRKFQACIDNNIELCLIDVSGFKYFKPQKAEKYLTIVTDVIDMKLFEKELHPA